ncbi:H/ACA ribonucleoprotein complex subunit GAR1 [Archaeoglobus sp.]
MRLKKIGKVSHVSKSGFIVVKAKEIPKIGSEVCNRKLEKVGYVYDIIGPIKSPFILIRPKDRKMLKKFDDELFVVEGGEDYGRKGEGKGGRKGKGERKGRGKRGRKRGDN